MKQSTKELEKQLVEMFGENATLAITNARIGTKGYYTRIESCGIPFRIEAINESQDIAYEMAINEFVKQTEIAIREKLFATQPDCAYEEHHLTNEDLDKIYKCQTDYNLEIINDFKKQTFAKVAHLPDGRFECVIDCSRLHLRVRGTGGTKKLAIASAIWNSHDVLNPTPIKVGDWYK